MEPAKSTSSGPAVRAGGHSPGIRHAGTSMKILALVSTLDLKYGLGCTPSWLQLLKGFQETGNEVIAIPYLGDPVQSLWWRTYENPCSWQSRLFNVVSKWEAYRVNGKTGVSASASKVLV